jgi:hypothetical protein
MCHHIFSLTYTASSLVTSYQKPPKFHRESEGVMLLAPSVTRLNATLVSPCYEFSLISRKKILARTNQKTASRENDVRQLRCRQASEVEPQFIRRLKPVEIVERLWSWSDIGWNAHIN